MKKILPIVLAAVLALSAVGCGATVESEPTTESTTIQSGMANPITEVGSLEELNALVGGKLTHPGVMGVTDESYRTIQSGEYTIAEYNFTVNDKVCTMRFVNNTTDDISGVYGEDGPVFKTTDDTFAKTAEYTVGRWFNVDGQYVFMVQGDADESWFKGICAELEELTMGGDGDVDGDAEEESKDYTDLYKSLAGSWQDTISERASAEITADGNNGIQITVSWAESATVTDVWTMTAKAKKDGRLYYTDCKHTKEEYPDNGEAKVTVEYENGEGSFARSEAGELLWDGAADENCRECAFEKMP